MTSEMKRWSSSGLVDTWVLRRLARLEGCPPVPVDRVGGRGYSPEFRVRAVEMYRWSGLSMARVADDLGISVGSLKMWVKRAQVDAGESEESRSSECEELLELRRENRELRERLEDLKKVVVLFAEGSGN